MPLKNVKAGSPRVLILRSYVEVLDFCDCICLRFGLDEAFEKKVHKALYIDCLTCGRSSKTVRTYQLSVKYFGAC